MDGLAIEISKASPLETPARCWRKSAVALYRLGDRRDPSRLTVDRHAGARYSTPEAPPCELTRPFGEEHPRNFNANRWHLDAAPHDSNRWSHHNLCRHLGPVEKVG
jgi:hypothetical protein